MLEIDGFLPSCLTFPDRYRGYVLKAPSE